MKQARNIQTIGVAGGVLSLAGLCVGILSLGKKAERRDRVVPPASVLPMLNEIELSVDNPGEPEFVLITTNETHEPDAIAPDNSVTTELNCTGLNTRPRLSRAVIADLAGKGESVVAIAQTLGISVGEVQLTLKLQGRTASAGRRL